MEMYARQLNRRRARACRELRESLTKINVLLGVGGVVDGDAHASAGRVS